MTTKGAGKISYCQFPSTICFDKSTNKVNHTSSNWQTDMITGQLIFRKPLCMAAWEFSYPLEQNFTIELNSFGKYHLKNTMTMVLQSFSHLNLSSI